MGLKDIQGIIDINEGSVAELFNSTFCPRKA